MLWDVWDRRMSLFGDDDIIEDLPERTAVQGEGLLPPRRMAFCLGHEIQEKLFLDLHAKNAVPHAMIFSGPEGIGKATMAFRLARFLLKTGKGDDNQDSLFGDAAPAAAPETLDVAPDDPVFSRVASGGHADLLYIERAFDEKKGRHKGALDVETLRKIEPFLRKTASEGGWRIVIIDDADTMNRSAQNAILKILEEPPANVLMILIAHRAGRLIPTIHSRARKIDFAPLSVAVMEDLLERQGLRFSPEELETLEALSAGSAGAALRTVQDGGLDTLAQIFGFLAYMPEWNWVKIHGLADTLSSSGQDKAYRLFADLFQWTFRQVLFAKARGHERLPPYMKAAGLEGFLKKSSLERLVGICDDLKVHFERADFSNLDRKEAVRGAFGVISG